MEFWSLVNRKVLQDGPFLPLKLFEHATQCFYSKAKGGLDGATQQRAILRCSTSHLRWKQKIVSQVFKTLTVNVFFAWRLYERRDLLSTTESFKSIDSFRNALNKVTPTAEFMLDAALHLLSQAQQLRVGQRWARQEEPQVPDTEAQDLISEARGRKRRRIAFFNSERGSKLRINVNGHVPKQCVSLYCVLCGQNTD